MTAPRKLFVAGATGATGQVLVPLARQRGIDVVPHVRPKTAAGRPFEPGQAVVDLSDPMALANAMRGCTTVLQLIGTMRKRFAAGDTYETSDVGTTVQLLEAARRVGVDHFLLLTSAGAGRPFGAYLKAKARAENEVVTSGVPYTIFRPGLLTGGARARAPLFRKLTESLGLKGLQPIELEELSSAMLHVAMRRAPLGVALESASLWEQVKASR
jgi:uncharacterized protein YbjT (DUF2867 family)